MQNRRYRTGNTNRIKRRSLGISFFIHFAGIFVLFTSPWNRPSAITYEIFTVQVIDIPEIEMPKKLPEEPSPSEKNSTPKKVKATVKHPVEKAVEHPAPKVPDFSAEKFRETLSAKIERSTPEKTPRKIEETPPVKIKKIESTVTDVNISNLNLTIPQWYISLVQNRIKENWRTYNTLGSRSTTVSFRIFRNGSIDNIALEKSSGNSGFDRSVIEAVRTTKDLPHFPKEIPDTHLDIVIDFKTEG